MLASILALLAQTQTFRTTTGSGGEEAMGMGMMCCCCGFYGLVIAAIVAGMWKAFAKAGEPGWAAIIPIYNIIVLLKISGQPAVRVIFWLIPIVGIYFQIVDTLGFVRSYGKDIGYLLLLILLPFVGWPMLGFGSAQYIGPAAGGSPPPPRPGVRR